MIKHNLVGKVFGRWTVVGLADALNLLATYSDVAQEVEIERWAAEKRVRA